MDIKDVENLANLARLDLSQEEKESMLKDMRGILEYVKQIEEIEVNPERSEPELRNVWREDIEIDINFSRESILKQFPEREGDFLKVKKIL